LLRYSFRHPLLFTPGTKYYYSNTNTILLGLVIEKVAGQPLAAYIERHVLRPDHLAHTVFPPGAGFPAPHAQGYTGPLPDGRLVNATGWNPSWGWAAGAMISTLGDLHTWARDVATGRLLTKAMQHRRERFLPIPLPGIHAGYGLGLFRINGWIGHNGSLPGYQSLTIYLPSRRATVVVLVNTDIDHRGSATTTLIGRAITRIITPRHVFDLTPHR
jgi:D-alanyl-D-alanine carboxypeptidase